MNDKKMEVSLLDQFAMAALAGGLEQGEPHHSGIGFKWHEEAIADRAYQIAGAMLRLSLGGRAEVPPRAEQAPSPARAAMTIPEFCEASGGISRAHFHKLVNDGNGPRLMKVGRRTLITAEAAAEWRRQMEGRNG